MSITAIQLQQVRNALKPLNLPKHIGVCIYDKTRIDLSSLDELIEQSILIDPNRRYVLKFEERKEIKP